MVGSVSAIYPGDRVTDGVAAHLHKSVWPHVASLGKDQNSEFEV